MTPAELREWRAAAGLEQTQLAAMLGVARQAVWRWEQARTPIPPYLHLALETLLRRLQRS